MFPQVPRVNVTYNFMSCVFFSSIGTVNEIFHDHRIDRYHRLHVYTTDKIFTLNNMAYLQ